jgi:hypothetical protein
MNAANERAATIQFAQRRNGSRVDAAGMAMTVKEQCARQAGLQERLVSTL